VVYCSLDESKITPDCDGMNNNKDNIDDIPSFSVRLPRGDNSEGNDWNDNIEDELYIREIILKEYLWRKVIKTEKLKI